MRGFSVTLAVLLAAIVLLGPGCYTLSTANSPTDQSVEMSNVNKATPVAHFQQTAWMHHFLFGLISSNKADITKMVANEVKLKGGSSAVNVKITYEMTFVQGLINVVTFGIYNPFLLTVEGDAVK